MRDLSLVAFTLLSQTAVGAFWVLGALQIWVARQSGPFDASLAPVNSTMVVLLMLPAILASLLHLGAPHKAWRVVANLRSSWLSREILFALLFTAASALFAGLQYFNLGCAAIRSAVGWIAALLGLLLILSMANAYRLRTVPAWDRWTTTASFLIAASLLGGLAVGVALGGSSSESPERLGGARPWIALGAVVLLALDLLVMLVWIAGLSAAPGAASRAAARITQERGSIFRARLALTVAAIIVSGAALTPWGEGVRASAVFALAFGLVLTAEVLGRVLFYEARVRHGV
jgi:anaerobic dimethyl sulfoxide reductase subunit C (anchor subunit)